MQLVEHRITGAVKQNHRMVWVEGIFKDPLLPAPCCGQGCLSPDHVARGPTQPSLELFQLQSSHKPSEQTINSTAQNKPSVQETITNPELLIARSLGGTWREVPVTLSPTPRVVSRTAWLVLCSCYIHLSNPTIFYPPAPQIHQICVFLFLLVQTRNPHFISLPPGGCVISFISPFNFLFPSNIPCSV